MKIFIKDCNKELINAELSKVSGKLSHTLYYDDLPKIVSEFEGYLDSHLLAKSHHKGALLDYVCNSVKPNSYKYSYDAISVTIERFSSGWALTDVKRKLCFPNQDQIVNMYLSEDQINTILEKTRSLFKVRFTPKLSNDLKD